MQVAGIAPGSLPTPEIVVKAAEAFATVYGDGVIPNTNLCNWIADNVAASGRRADAVDEFLPRSLPQSGRRLLAHRLQSRHCRPVEDWSGLVQQGDIVRMGWFKPEAGRISGHSTTALVGAWSDNEIKFFDNNDGQHIGIHNAAYWLATDPDDITIYRLDPNQQYLIQGTDAAETIRGSVYDNLIRPGGGNDVIDAKLGNNEIEGSVAQLNEIKVKHFDFGRFVQFHRP